MKIFHKDKDKEKQKEKTREIHAPQETEDVSPAEEAAAEIDKTAAQELAYNADEKEQNPDSRMEEIYSTKAKQVKFRRQEPLEEEAAAKRKEAAKDELMRGQLEFSLDDREDAPEVMLEPELDPNAVVAEEIIEDVVDVKKLRNIYVQDIDDIDVSLDPMEAVNEYERGAADTARRDARQTAQKPEERTPSAETVVAKVPIYQHESKFDYIYLKAGRFTDVVESEYDEYLKSTDPTISKNYHAMRPEVKPHQSLLYTLSQMAARRKQESEEKQKSKDILRNNFDEEMPKPKKKKRSRVGRFFRVLGAVIASSFTAPSRSEQERTLDYNSREDEKYLSERTRKNFRRLAGGLALFSVICVIMVALVIWERTCGAAAIAERGNGIAVAYCTTQLVLTLIMGLIGRHTLLDGLKPLKRFKGNSATVLALAYIACVIQSIVAMFTTTSFVGGDHHLYSFVVSIALVLHTAGRLMMVTRVKNNFDFISSRSPAYAAKIYNDEEAARRMAGGTVASKGVVAYQHVTSFLSDFLKISYAPDPSEDISGKFMPITVISALFVTILYAILFKSVPGAFSALAVMLSIGIPFTAMVAGNLPMMLFSRKMLDEDAMVAGYPSVRQFCDTDALLMRASDLFPDGCVELSELLPLQQLRVEDGLLMAAAVLREAHSPIAPVFDELVMENRGMLPMVENVLYEDKSGLVGWINGERILIGNLTLMNRYHITIPEDGNLRRMERSGEPTYIAVAGQVIAAMALTYQASPIAKEQIQQAEKNGLALIVSTTDANVTDEMIADRYEIFYRSVKVTAPGYSDLIDEAVGKTEETSRAYLATRGRAGSLARAVGGCIVLKANIRLGIVIEIFGMLLGILLSATLALYASVARLSAFELLIYIGFWVTATLIAEIIKRP